MELFENSVTSGDRHPQGEDYGVGSGVDVTGVGRGIVSLAGASAVRLLAQRTGLVGALSAVVPAPGVVVHARGRVVTDLAVAVLAGGEAISDIDTWSRRSMSRRSHLAYVRFGIAALPKGKRSTRLRERFEAEVVPLSPGASWPSTSPLGSRTPSCGRPPGAEESLSETSRRHRGDRHRGWFRRSDAGRYAFRSLRTHRDQSIRPGGSLSEQRAPYGSVPRAASSVRAA